MKWIVITGNPKDGFTHIGPFGAFEEAMFFADALESDWWIVQLEHPRDTSLHSVRAELHEK